MCLISRGRDFQTDGKALGKDRCPNVLVLIMCGTLRALESEEERSLVETRHEEGQTDKQGMC